jgi:hypothetical protein
VEALLTLRGSIEWQFNAAACQISENIFIRLLFFMAWKYFYFKQNLIGRRFTWTSKCLQKFIKKHLRWIIKKWKYFKNIFFELQNRENKKNWIPKRQFFLFSCSDLSLPIASSAKSLKYQHFFHSHAFSLLLRCEECEKNCVYLFECERENCYNILRCAYFYFNRTIYGWPIFQYVRSKKKKIFISHSMQLHTFFEFSSKLYTHIDRIEERKSFHDRTKRKEIF